MTKYRLWDKISKKMYYDGHLENGTEVVLKIDGGLLFEDNDTYKESDFVVMQWTGLKDKNGKEIYEGDIVVIPRYDGDFVELEHYAEVKYYENKFCCNQINTGYYREYDLTKLEIIGNKFENPELLKD